MHVPAPPAYAIARQELVGCLRIRMEQARIRFIEASAAYCSDSGKLEVDLSPANGTRTITAQTVAEARAEYARAVRTFTEFLLDGDRAARDSTAASENVLTLEERESGFDHRRR